MRPLVYYCRWHDATLRIMGRTETAVIGELAYDSDEKEDDLFHFDLRYWLLTLGQTEPSEDAIKLDEKGTVIANGQ